MNHSVSFRDIKTYAFAWLFVLLGYSSHLVALYEKGSGKFASVGKVLNAINSCAINPKIAIAVATCILFTDIARNIINSKLLHQITFLIPFYVIALVGSPTIVKPVIKRALLIFALPQSINIAVHILVNIIRRKKPNSLAKTDL